MTIHLPKISPDVWTPATPAEKKKALAALGSLPSRATSSEELDRAAYHVSLDRVTRYGLAEAVRNILQGALGHAFFPSPPELRLQCNKAMVWHEEHAAEVRYRARANEEFMRQGLDKKIEKSPAEKARVAQIYADFCKANEGDKPGHITAADRADIRARNNMTDAALAGIADRKPPADRSDERSDYSAVRKGAS